MLPPLQVKSGKGGALSAETCVGADLTIKQTTFTGNMADNTTAFLDAGYGGALHVTDLGSMGSLTMDGGVAIRDNTAGVVSARAVVNLTASLPLMSSWCPMHCTPSICLIFDK